MDTGLTLLELLLGYIVIPTPRTILESLYHTIPVLHSSYITRSVKLQFPVGHDISL